MKTKLRNTVANLLASYWFIPGAMCLGLGAAALLAIKYDASLKPDAHHWWSDWMEVNTTEGARELLSTIAGSTITLAGVIFSITVLALSFASSQFGPRLLRNFMRDRASQVVLGTFVSTYLYSLLVLRTIGPENPRAPLPHVAIAGSLLLALTSVALLIFFIHHIARSIQVSSIITAVGADLDTLIHDFVSASSPERKVRKTQQIREVNNLKVRGLAQGYVQAISREALVKIADSVQGLIELHITPGDYVFRGKAIASIRSATAVDRDVVAVQLQTAVVLGAQRTNAQDLDFPIDQLAEIAVRALSPSMNDPFTAIYCINQLAASINHLTQYDWPDQTIINSEGFEVVILLPMSLARVLQRSFDQILHYGHSNPTVPRHVMKLLSEIVENARPQHRSSIGVYSDQVLAYSEDKDGSPDTAELDKFHQAIKRSVNSTSQPV